MPIKMRILYDSSKGKIKQIADKIKTTYELSFNSVDVIPPAYSCDKERIVILAVSGKSVSSSLSRFLGELTKARAQNTALILDGPEENANAIKEILTKAGTHVIPDVMYVKCGLFGGLKDEEWNQIKDWIDTKVIPNLA
ncbi:MAG: hypothetical protein IJU20_01615 [Clostridia bacterium]|nr:hypothetical protein [Clostridia bacterium]